MDVCKSDLDKTVGPMVLNISKLKTRMFCVFLGDGFWMALAWIHIQPYGKQFFSHIVACPT